MSYRYLPDPARPAAPAQAVLLSDLAPATLSAALLPHWFNRWALPLLAVLAGLGFAFLAPTHEAAAQGTRLPGYNMIRTSAPYRTEATQQQYGTASSDDEGYRNIAFGFTFPYNGQTFQDFTLTSNGFLTLGSNAFGTGGGTAWISVSNSSGRVFVPAGVNNQSISGFNMDLKNRTGGELGVLRGGAAPNRFLMCQYRDYKRFGAVFDNDTVNFQMVMFETGVIEFRYGLFTSREPTTHEAQIGLRGDNNQDLLTVLGNPGWASLVRSSGNEDGVPYGPGNIPPTGLVLRFVPTPPTQNNLAALAVLAATTAGQRGCQLTTQEPIVVRVSNVGAQAQTSARVGYRINGGPIIDRVVTFSPALATGASQDITFSGAQGADLSAFNTYQLQGFVTLATDTSRGNDTARRVFVSQGPIRASELPTIRGLVQGRPHGLRRGRGNPLGPDTASRWQSTRPFANTETIGIPVADTALRVTDWLYLPGVRSEGVLGIRFRMAITALASSAAVTSMGDDSLHVMVSSGCPSTWRRLASYGQGDLTANRIGAQLRTYQATITQTDEVFSIGFWLDNRGTTLPAGQGYRIHVTDLAFFSSADMAAVTLAGQRPGDGRVLGYCSNDPLSINLVVRNNGLVPVTQLTAGYRIGRTGGVVTRPFTVNLAPGQQDTLRMTGATLGRPPFAGRDSIKVFVSQAGESAASRRNDSLSIAFRAFDQITQFPTVPINTVASVASQGWYYVTGQGFGPSSVVTGFVTSRPYAPSDTILTFFSNARDPHVPVRQWLVSPTFSHPAREVILSLEASLLDSTFGIYRRTASIGDDSLVVLYRFNCGEWVRAGSISQATLDTGGLDTLTRAFRWVLPVTQAGVSQVALRATNGTMRNVNSYRLNFRQVRMTLGDPLSTTRPAPIDVSPGLSLVPNPTTGQVVVTVPIRPTLTGTPIQRGRIEVLSVAGRVMLSAPMAGSTTRLDVSRLPAGVYLVRVTTLVQSWQGRLVRQ